MNTFEKVTVVTLMVLLVCLGHFLKNREDRHLAACTEKGGVLLTRDGVCIKANTVININR
jgi:hypothetical protein